MDILLELHYLPCIQFFSKFEAYDHVIIDDVESFEKQNYRNRCSIAGANGKIDLTIPVHQSRKKLPIREILIDNHIHWQHQHWQSIQSAYGKTAFFEHYAHLLAPVYEKPFDKLFDFNLELLLILMKILKIEPSKLLQLSETNISQSEVLDFRNKIHPKPKFQAEDPLFTPTRYQQAFETKNGFIPNLGVIDEVFNLGVRHKG
jgi:hypothetical protein